MKELHAVGADEAEWVADQRRWAAGWRRVVFPAIFLAWLVQVVRGNSQGHPRARARRRVRHPRRVLRCYVVTVPAGWQCDERRYRLLIAVLSRTVRGRVALRARRCAHHGVFSRR